MPSRQAHDLPTRDPSTPVGSSWHDASISRALRSCHHLRPEDAEETDPREFDARVRELAQCAVEAIWDELEPLGLHTGEIVDYGIFPVDATDLGPCRRPRQGPVPAAAPR